MVYKLVKPNTKPTRTVKAAETAFTILETLKENDGMRLTELADELGMAKSTTHRYLQTLLSKEYLVVRDDVYYPSLRFLDFGWQARNREDGYEMAKTKVEDIAEETNERAQFIVEEHWKGVYVHRRAGSNAVHTDPGIGKRIDLHTISAGKAIMAEWPDDQIDEYIDANGLRARTDNTITDDETLRGEIEQIRQRGYSVNNQENIEGLRAIGVSVCSSSDEVLGAFSVSGPMNRMRGEWFEEKLPNMLMGYANEIELNLKYP